MVIAYSNFGLSGQGLKNLVIWQEMEELCDEREALVLAAYQSDRVGAEKMRQLARIKDKLAIDKAMQLVLTY